SQNTVDTLQRLATGNLTSAADLLSGAASALSVAGDVSPQVATAMRGLNAVQAGVGTILQTANDSRFPAVRAAAEGVTSALDAVRQPFNRFVSKDSAALDDVRSTATGLATGAFGTGVLDGASSSTPHLMTLATDAGQTFHFNLSTAAFDTLRRATHYRVATQERLNRQEALQAVSVGGETITLSGVVFPQLGASVRQIERLRAIGADMKPVQLTTGAGDVLGRWYLQRIDEEQHALLADGVPRKQTFSLEFGRYGEDFKHV
ncbi:phage tail protein, partial [Burkholderia sp. Nafp2/4-1b]|uniref:phage tail protein n=1 Tax=Burkholderia sp. Nafp2/4-1b TaxID=2116686 RepID=UPI001F09EA09